MAVIHHDPDTGNQDIWAFDVATGNRYAVTSDPAQDSAPVWSPDGKEIAFVSTRGDYTGVYRKRWNGTGREGLVYQHTPGTPSVVLTDWSADGRFMSFYAGDVLYVLPLRGDPRPIEVVRTEFSTVGGRFAPDHRFLAYLSDQTGRYELYVAPFAPSLRTAPRAARGPWQVSNQGAAGMIFWRGDGKEISYLAADGDVMAVDVVTAPAFTAGTPRVLFRPPNSEGGGPYSVTANPSQLRNISRDGQRFVFAVTTSGRTPAR